MVKGLVTLVKNLLGNTVKWCQHLSTTLTKNGTVIRKSITNDHTMKYVQKIYSKGSHMADLGVKKTNAVYVKSVKNMAKPNYDLTRLHVTLNNGKRLNLNHSQAKQFFNVANNYHNFLNI